MESSSDAVRQGGLHHFSDFFGGGPMQFCNSSLDHWRKDIHIERRQRIGVIQFIGDILRLGRVATLRGSDPVAKSQRFTARFAGDQS